MLLFYIYNTNRKYMREFDFKLNDAIEMHFVENQMILKVNDSVSIFDVNDTVFTMRRNINAIKEICEKNNISDNNKINIKVVMLAYILGQENEVINTINN